MTVDINELRQSLGAVTPEEVGELLDRLEATESECLEEARLNGIGSEREAALMAKLEAAKKERGIDEQRIADLMEELNRVGHENDALRAKIEHMENQEPVAWTYEDMLGRKCVGFDKPLHRPNTHEPLYALPGAKGE